MSRQIGSTAASRVLGGMHRRKIVAWCVCALLALGADSSSRAEETGDRFFAGRTLEILVPYATGGGTDIQARFMAPFLEKHIAGNPEVQVINVPGADGVIGLNEFALNRPPDGQHVALATGATSLLYLLREPGVRYDLRRFVPVLAIPGGNVFYVSPKTGVREVADLKNVRQPLHFAAATPVGGDTLALVALEILGIEVNVVMGYRGRGPARVAFEQGETNLDHQSAAGYKVNVAPLVEIGKAIPLFTAGQMERGRLVRDPVFPNLPTVGEAYAQLHGAEPSGEAWNGYRALVATLNTMQKILWFHDEAPQEAIDAVKDAALRMARDADFVSGSEKFMGGYSVIVGGNVDAEVDALLGTTTPVSDWVLDFLVREYGVRRR